MKHLFKLGTLLAVAFLLSGTMMSCDNDEPDDQNKETPGNEDEALCISSINNLPVVYDEQGRVSSIGYSSYGWSVDYSKKTITFTKADDQKIVHDVEFNAEGYITKVTSESFDEDTHGNFVSNFKYNNVGNLIEANHSSQRTGTDEVRNQTETITLNWNEGKLIKIRQCRTTTYSDAESTDSKNSEWISDIKYGLEKNKHAQVPLSLGSAATGSNFYMLCIVGFFGKGPSNLPTGITEIYKRDGIEENSVVVNLSFKLNAMGWITNETERDENDSSSFQSFSYTYK